MPDNQSHPINRVQISYIFFKDIIFSYELTKNEHYFITNWYKKHIALTYFHTYRIHYIQVTQR